MLSVKVPVRLNALLSRLACEKQLLTWQSDESLTSHPSSQQAVYDSGPVLRLEPGEQRHQLGHWCLCTQVLYTQNLQRDAQIQKKPSMRRCRYWVESIVLLNFSSCDVWRRWNMKVIYQNAHLFFWLHAVSLPLYVSCVSNGTKVKHPVYNSHPPTTSPIYESVVLNLDILNTVCLKLFLLETSMYILIISPFKCYIVTIYIVYITRHTKSEVQFHREFTVYSAVK